jgi:hypothetical protein
VNGEHCGVSVQICKIEEALDTAQQTVRGRGLIEVEGMKQAVVVAAVLSEPTVRSLRRSFLPRPQHGNTVQ